MQRGFGYQNRRNAGFSPASLFTGGVQGAWYDPSDLTTLFQDSAGTTPVTAVEQPVGRILDKSGRGNHAFQTTSASRPTLRARYNLLTRSEEFDNAAWTSVDATITANAGVAPDGSTTADKFTPNNTIATAYLVQTGVPTSAGTYTVSVYAKAVELTAIRVGDFGNPTDGYGHAVFNLSAGTVTSQTNCTATIANADNGWYRCAITRTLTSGTSNQVQITRNTVTGNGTSGVLIWGAQLTQTAVFPSNVYQRIGAATDYATGAAFPPYLAFDGVDDSMLTNSVDFTGTDKMLVVAGVTKQSDAGTGTVVELSSSAANNGMFDIFAPDSPNEYVYGSRASTTYRNALIDSAAYAAPITNVVTGISDIAAPLVNLRLNGASINSNTASQGTGNYGNYPLYIGRRNNASLPFNGNIYSLVIAGALYSAGQVSSTEQWVAAKTPLGSI